MKLSVPLLAVADMAKSRSFYEQVLKETVIQDFGANITFDGGFALQTLPTWAGFIETEAANVRFGNDFELYFEEKDFDAFLDHLKKFPELEYIHPLKCHDWGQRVVRFCDPDKHIIEVGESMESVVKRFLKQGLSKEEASRRSMYSLDFVQKCAEELGLP